MVDSSNGNARNLRNGPLFFHRMGGGGGYHFWDLQTTFSEE